MMLKNSEHSSGGWACVEQGAPDGNSLLNRDNSEECSDGCTSVEQGKQWAGVNGVEQWASVNGVEQG